MGARDCAPVTIELDASQAEALELAAVEPICIVTGGPGTGKTTIIRALLDRIGGRVVLCAPTGKAAKRMSEATGREAKTIHRALGFSPVEGWYHNEDNPLEADVVVVDEASMVDTELFARLTDAIDPECTRLVLVGDANQLPSVGPGAILRDLVNGSPVPCARLTHVHRSQADSWVCANAPKIITGKPIATEDCADFRFVEAESASDVPEACGKIVAQHRATQVLVPQKTGKAGAEAINAALQRKFNPLRGRKEWGKDPHLLRTGDRVIHTKNDYELGVFNGEVGTVVEVSDKVLSVDYADRALPVEYNRDAARSLRLAYALTIHKSQGSEWDWVCVVVHSTHTYMLTRQLFYTAVTRAKSGVVIVGNAQGIESAIKSKRDSVRNTALCDRIAGVL